ncbi:RHS repeat domain-containing protein [Brevibacillus laterosporus]|uniref:tRNA(Glu)-specific nuclease WapA n=8 Tax=Brevibacillus laterosporus TaxID=1465 RepID=A0A075R3Q9_BRELA|nr:RHS repeat-associated core domain-containing protein [Brevibacillus laterosporus]AIG26121.1 tRNA(Glu)-specific nuclease WapA precursor [Brevibacillus laterosporus LMG 15441]
MYRKWVSSFLCVAILWTGLFTNVNVVGATEAPERNEEIRKTNEKDTKDWIIEEQEKVEQQEKEPTSTKGDVTKEQIAQMKWEQLPLASVQQLFDQGDRTLLQIVAYYYTDVHQLLTEEEINQLYTWNDEQVMGQLANLSAEKVKLLEQYAPSVIQALQDWRDKDKPKARVKRMASALAPSPSMHFTEKEQSIRHFTNHVENPVDDIYLTSNMLETDLTLEGKHGMDLVIQRRYNSLSSKITAPGFEYSETAKENRTSIVREESGTLPHTVGTGWSFNLPTFDEITKELGINVHDYSNQQFYEAKNTKHPVSQFIMSGDDWSTIDSSKKLPYQNIKLPSLMTNRELGFAKDGYSYSIEYREKGSTYIVEKQNIYGDKITYKIPDYKSTIEIIDTVGRRVEIGYGKEGMIDSLKVYNQKNNLIKELRYHYGDPNNTQRLESVEEVKDGKSTTIARYSYKTATAEYNYIKSYELPKENNEAVKPDQLESEAYLAKDKQKRQFIEYLLLQKVEYPTQGLTVDYTYSTYNPEPTNPFERGVIRLYQDNQAISYYTYHPVTSVRFSYDQTSSLFGNTERKSFIYYYKFTNQGKPTKEIWKTPKSGITRLSNHPLRQGDIVTIEETNSFSSQSTERTYRVNENEHFNLILEKQISPKEQSEQIAAEGKNYRYNPVSYTSYAYEGIKTKPAYVYHFVDNLPEGEAKQYLLAPQIDKRDKIENLSSLANEAIYKYDQNGDVTEQKDPNGLTTHYSYIEVGTLGLPVLVEQVAGDGHAKKQEYVYNRDNLLETETITAKYPGQEYEDKLLRTYKYGDKKLPISLTEVQFGASDEFSHFSKSFTYDQNDLHVSTEQITAYNGENSLETYAFTYRYDDLDFLVTKQFPDESIVGYFYDELGRIQKEMFISTDGDNRETKYSYTNRDRTVMKSLPNKTGLITSYTPAGEVVFSVEVDSQGNRRTLVENSYAEDGKRLVATYPYGKKEKGTTYSYHSDGTLKTVTDALKRTTTMQYANQVEDSSLIIPVEKTIAPNGLETTQLYDRYGQMITSMVQTADGTLSTETQMQYDRFGNPTHKQITNEQGEKRSWDYKYDLRGEPIYVKDPEKNVYKFQYNANGNLMSTFENDKETARYVFNGLSWKLREIDPATEKIKENYEYDQSGNLTSFTDQKGNIRKYTYTPFYELDTMQVLSGKKVVETEKNTYDPTTRQLVTQQNNDTKVSYTYDSFLRPTSMTTFGRTYEQRYEDEDDIPDSIVYPDGTITAYNYDELGRILSVKHPGMDKITYEYDTSTTGDTVHVQYPNGTKVEKGFDSFGQTTDVQHFQANNKAWTEQNQYNGFGNLVETTVNQSASTFGYDKLDRIRKETTPTRKQTYTYDERGNRQSILTAKSPTIADSSYTYDALNRLKTYAKNGKESTYTYYPGELRASKKINGKTTHYVYLNGNVIEELDEKNNLQARNIWGNELLYHDDVKGDKQGYYYTNAHGDIVEIKDKDGQTLNKYEYDLWGNVESKQETMSNPFLYAGELYDEESGLIYLRARYYDPNDGRFITEDTYKGQVDNPLSLNRYTYVHNNPVGNVDPTGNWCESKDGKWAHPGGCSSKSSKKSHDNDHSGDFIIENGKVIGAFKYDDGSGARELEGFEDPFTYITGVGGLLKGAVKTGAKKVTQEATNLLIKMDLQFFSKGTSKYIEPWIQKSAYKAITDKFGKNGAHKFAEAMKKGLVGPKGQEGIKPLKGSLKKNGVIYTHEIKILDKQLGDYRIYGRFDKERSQFIFDWFDKGLHN